MRLAVAILGAVAGACSSAATMPPPEIAAAAQEATIFVSDGGVLRPIANGSRLALRQGWAEMRVSPLPIPEKSMLDVTLFGSDGRVLSGEVDVAYESLDMDHGRLTAKGVRDGDRYRVPLSFLMPGSWRLLIHVVGTGADGTVTLVLHEVGF